MAHWGTSQMAAWPPQGLVPFWIPPGGCTSFAFRSARSAPCHKLSSQTLNPLSGWERGADHLGGISGYIERGK